MSFLFYRSKGLILLSLSEVISSLIMLVGAKFLQAASSFSNIIGYARIVASIGAFHNIVGKADYSRNG